MNDLLEILEETHQISGGHCGQTVVSIARKSGMDPTILKKELRSLFEKGKINVRDGAQGKLILLNK